MCDGECLLELRQEDADFKAPIWATLEDPEFKRGEVIDTTCFPLLL